MQDISRRTDQDTDLGFNTEYQNKRFLIRAFYGVAVPVVSIILVLDVIKERYLIAFLLLLILITVLSALASSFGRLPPRREYTIYIWTFTILSILVGVICLIAIGLNAEMSRLPWVYLYMVLVINAFGFRTSLIWAVLFLALLISVLYFNHQLGPLQGDGFFLRFIGTYVFLTLSMALIKQKRQNFQDKFIHNHRILQESESRLREINNMLTKEIEDRIQIEQALRRSEERLAQELKEKNVLIKEIHHRVKNNMQIISSLLRLQIQNECNEQTRAGFQEAINRIGAMAMVHEEIYRSDTLAVIDLMAYITSLTNGVLGSYESNRARISVSIDVEKDIRVSPSFAVPFGLALNELITNAIKHAFPNGGSGIIYVSVKKKDDDVIEFRLADSGIGFPPGYNPSKAETMGIYLVYRLLEGQLHGTIQVNSRQGTEYLVTLQTDAG